MTFSKRLAFLTAIFSMFPYVTQAQYLSAKDIYEYARTRNYWALSKITRYVDMQDKSGNTALCLAVIDGDYQTYNLLRQYGANPQPYCLQSAIAASSSSTFLGMGTTGWLTTGAIVAAGAGVAAAVGGGGGGGGSSDSSSSNNSSPSITCVNGSISNDECICNEGWTGATCNEAAEGYTLFDDVAYPTLACANGSTQDKDHCTCGDGWTGTLCNTPAVCGDGYKISCDANEYTTGETCPSGGNTLKKCLAHSSMPNCSIFSTTSDTCETCKTGYAGATCTQAADGYTLFDEVAYPTLACANGSTQDKDHCICGSGWTGTLCDTPASCGANYKASCEANEYTTGNTCPSGGNTLMECLAHSAMPNCQTPSSNSDTCETCKTGYAGTTCTQAADGYTLFDEVAYPTLACANGSTQDKDHCTCGDGWTGATCSEAADCGANYKASCEANEYTTGETCPSGGNTLMECLAHSAMPNCQTPSSNSDTCETCKTGYAGTTCTQAADGYTLFDEVAYPTLACANGSTQDKDHCTCGDGWTGTLCDTPAVCGDGYKLSCDTNEYTTGETCPSGGNTLYKCLLHSEMPNCSVFSTTSDTCTTCNEGWTGTLCNTPAVCGDGYKISCDANEYTTGETCPSGGNTLTECLAHSAMPNC
ncbi:MAG: hypothetical protein IJ830_01555 [Alphaproteobacteria bacterium]|nr:hypothetical protein [Alphaproteobacteria bacterium]